MPDTERRLYRFGEFSFDVEQNILMRGDETIALTPKMLALLHVLIENAGRVLEKDALMEKVWADSFVEEGNLKFNINQIRRALGDDAHHPRFIETVPKRGYRFIAAVETLSAAPPFRVADFQAARAGAPPQRRIFMLAVAILPLLLLAALFWRARGTNSEADAPVLSAPFSSEKLTTGGKVFHAVISADGKTVAYTNIVGDRTSVWLRQLESSNNVEIIPPSDNFYFGLALSPDGNFIYFARRPRESRGQSDIYRVSIFGGVPVEIVREAQGWMSISPDGTLISFVRCYYHDDENCALWVADAADGRNARKLAARARPFRIGDNEFAPDGRTIAFAVGQSENQANEFGLSEVDLETGAERELTPEKFFNIKSVAWLGARSGLLVTASRIPNKNYRIWRIDAGGEALPLTKDSETYANLTLDRRAAKLCATQIKEDFRLRLSNLENPSETRTLIKALTVAFAPSGKIIFSSTVTGNEEIWSIDPDGAGQKQLTTTAADESMPLVSPDGKTVYFTSNRTGTAQVWRMNTDGTDQTQITQTTGGFPLFVSTDGKWVYFHHALNRTLWRVSATGGEEQPVLEKRKDFFAVSPDGLQIAFPEKQGETTMLDVVSLASGQTIKVFELAEEKANLTMLHWMADGKNLAYNLANSEFKQNALWFQPLDGKAPRRAFVLSDEEINSFAVSPDGRTIAFVEGGWRPDTVLLTGLK